MGIKEAYAFVQQYRADKRNDTENLVAYLQLQGFSGIQDFFDQYAAIGFSAKNVDLFNNSTFAKAVTIEGMHIITANKATSISKTDTPTVLCATPISVTKGDIHYILNLGIGNPDCRPQLIADTFAKYLEVQGYTYKEYVLSKGVPVGYMFGATVGGNIILLLHLYSPIDAKLKDTLISTYKVALKTEIA